MKRKLKKNKITIDLIELTGGRALVLIAPLIQSLGPVFSGLKSRLRLVLRFTLASLRATIVSIIPSLFPLFLLSLLSSLLLVLLLTPLLTPVHAFEKDFPPYPNGKFPPVCKIHPLKAASESDRNKGHFKSVYKDQDKGLKLALHLDMNYKKGTSGVYLRVNNVSGESLVSPVKVGGHPNDIAQVYWAYLNKDNHKDYIITVNGGDGYLSGGRQKATFLLSKKGKEQGYASKSLGVYSLKQQDFYDYSTDNKCEFLHQSLVHDGQNNYWVYNVLQFLDGKIVLKNELSRFFPKWIKLTAANNDQSAPLSKAKKNQLSKKTIKQMGAALK